MKKSIQFLFILAIAAFLTACNNTNKPNEEVKAEDAPTMSAKQQALSDVQTRQMNDTEGTERNSFAQKTAPSQNPNNGGMSDLSQATEVTDENGKKVRAVPNENGGTDADRLRARAAAQRKTTVAAPKSSGTPARNNTPAPAPAPERKTVQDAKVQSPATDATPAPQGAPAHDAWNSLLTQYVDDNGKVNYRGLKSNVSKLDAYLETLKNNPPQASWSRNEKMAYWINAYNAFTVKKIVSNYPLNSIRDLSGGKVWDDKWINIGDKSYSLNEIENGILRPTYKDARIHFAVNCAAKSCPPLYNRAFTAGNLERNLDKLTDDFINDPAFNTISAGSVKVSKIFDWYKDDFGNLTDYLNEYADTKINADAQIGYTDYDWGLNE